MKRIILVVVAAGVIVAILAGGAYFATQMLFSPKEASLDAEFGNPVRVMESVIDDGSGPVSMRIIVEPAPELPDRPAEASGIFVRKQDNSIFVGTGNIELDVEVNNDETTVSLSSDGPEIEVVVTRDTVFYQEVTDMKMVEPSARKSGERHIQQELRKVDSIEEIGENTEIQAWGRQRGDRVTAEVLVFRQVSVDF
jgi:hypothetical protein